MTEQEHDTELFMCTDWEKDTWARIYYKFISKKCLFTYTFSLKDVSSDKQYPHVLKNISKVVIKKAIVEKKETTTKQDTPSNSETRRQPFWSVERIRRSDSQVKSGIVLRN